MSNRNIYLFVEDYGHEVFLDALVHRLAKQHNLDIKSDFKNARGGYGTAISELKLYIHDLQRGKERLPDLLIAATDGNCKGYVQRKQEIDKVTKGFSHLVICAIPDPHIEKWLLLDSAAFKRVLGKGCNPPDTKCDRGRYKRLLEDAVANAGEEPIFGGMEHAEALVNAMDLKALEQKEASIGKLLKELRHKFQEWERNEHDTPPETPQSRPPHAENPPT